MARTGNWRIPASYRYALDLTDAQFAWEFLRRNPEFRADQERRPEPASSLENSDDRPTPETDPDPDPKPSRRESPHRADAAARWGLHFRAELAGAGGQGDGAFLAA